MKKFVSVFLSFVILICCFSVSTTAYAKFSTSNDDSFKVSVNDFHRPTMLKPGASFAIKGKIKATKKIKTLQITVEDLNQFTTQINFKKSINSKSLDLSNYSQKIQFSKLDSGEKRINIILKSVDGDKVLLKRNFTILGKAKEPKHITKKCKITTTSGKVENVLDSDDTTYWNNGTMTIKIPAGKKVEALYLTWRLKENNYTIKSYSKDDELLDQYSGKDYYFYRCYYPINEDAKKIIINLKKRDKNYNGIARLRVYEKGFVGVSVEKWQRPKNGECDLMVISCHRDDELLFFGGTIPYYSNVRNKNVYTMYVSGQDKGRAREAMAGLWSMGITTYPIFMENSGGYHKDIATTLKDWGGEDAVLEKMVSKIRQYQPKVIVTHSSSGEYGHPSHKTTSYLVTKAVKYAAISSYYPESYNKYGICKVQKVYKHCENQNKIKMNWSKSYSQLDGKTPLQLATIGYDKHRSQHSGWSMNNETTKKYPNTNYGLVYTRVGNDQKKNDFFEHVK